MTNSIEQQDRERFDRIAGKYARKDVIPSSSHARAYQTNSAMARVLGEGRVGTLVEIACGVGASAKYLAGSYRRYVGVDYSAELIREARLFHRGAENVEFVVSNVNDLTAGSVPAADCVLAVGALHHFTEIHESLEAIKAISKPGAPFVAIEPQSANPFIQGLRTVRTKIDRGYSPDQHFFAAAELQALLAEHGFENIMLEYKFFLTPPFAEVPFRPQALSHALSRMAVAMDRRVDHHLPKSLRRLSWNLVSQAHAPKFLI